MDEEDRPVESSDGDIESSDRDVDRPAPPNEGDGRGDDVAGSYRAVYENRVRFAETDMQGIVFYGEYFTYQDEAMSAYLRAIGYDYETIDERGWVIHVGSTSLSYRHSARFEDVVVNEIRVARIGRASIEFDYRARRKEDGQVLVEGSVTHVAVDPETGESTRVPDEFRSAVESFQGGLESS